MNNNREMDIRNTVGMVDVTKLICSLLVVAIHVPPFNHEYAEWNHLIQSTVCRLAVPLFFVFTGYFLFDLKKFTVEKIKKYICTLLKVYFIWSLIYLPLAVYKCIGNGLSLRQILIVQVKGIFISGIYYHLWYIPAIIVAVVLVAMCISYGVKSKPLIFVSCILYMIGLLGQSWFGLAMILNNSCPVIGKIGKSLSFIVPTTRNGLFEGFIFVVLGYLLSQKKYTTGMKRLIIRLLISFSLFIVEFLMLDYFGWIRENDMYLFLIPTVYYIAAIVTNIDINLDTLVLRKLSSLIYYSHIIYFEIFKSVISGTQLYIIVLMLSICGGFSVINLSKKSKFSFLKYLF